MHTVIAKATFPVAYVNAPTSGLLGFFCHAGISGHWCPYTSDAISYSNQAEGLVLRLGSEQDVS